MNSRTKDIGGSELSQEIAGRGRRRRARDPITAFPGAGSQAKRIFAKETHDQSGGGDDQEEYGGHCDRGNAAANQPAEFCPQSENRYCRDRYKCQPCARDPGCDEPEPRGPRRECGPHSCGYTSDANVTQRDRAAARSASGSGSTGYSGMAHASSEPGPGSQSRGIRIIGPLRTRIRSPYA